MKTKRLESSIKMVEILTADEMDDVLGRNVSINDFVASKLEEILPQIDVNRISVASLTKMLQESNVIGTVDFEKLQNVVKKQLKTHLNSHKEKRKENKGEDVFTELRVRQKIKIPLNYPMNVKSIHNILSKLLLRYVPELQGVVMTYDNVQPLEQAAFISYQPPYQMINIQYAATIFAPHVGSELFGTVTHIVPSDSVSLSVLGHFQVSIPFSGCNNEGKQVLSTLVEDDIVRFHVYKIDVWKTEISITGVILAGDGKIVQDSEQTSVREKKRKQDSEDETPVKKKTKK